MPFPPLLARLLVRAGVARLLPGVRRALGAGADFLPYWSDRLLGSPFSDMARAGEALRPVADDVIHLGQGAPHFDRTPTASTKLPADRRGWPPVAGLPELRAAVAEHLRVEGQLAFDPGTEVLITAGALGAVHTALDAFVNAGDRVVLFDP